MKRTCETIAVEGGEAGTQALTPAQRYEIDQRTAAMLLEAVKHIPQRHRLGWYQAFTRYAGLPLTSEPTQSERDYLAWSAQRLAGPRKAKP